LKNRDKNWPKSSTAFKDERRLPFVFHFSAFTLKSSLFTFSFLLFTLIVNAQTWEPGLFIGGAGYQGDLDTRNLYKTSALAGGVSIQRNFNPYFAFKLAYTHGKIAAADSSSKAGQPERNLSFHSQLDELSLMGEFNFMKYMPGYDPYKYRFSPFVFLGVGLTSFNPQADYQGQTYDLRPLHTEGQTGDYTRSTLVIPYGGGIKYNFASSWNIALSAGYRYVRTDYLDDVSGTYANKALFTNSTALALSDRSGERTGVYLGTPGSQRGDSQKNDTYFYIGFTLTFTILTSNCYY